MEHVASDRSIDAQLDGYGSKLISSGAIRSAAVETAFRRVRRHRLIEGFYPPGKYGDDDLVVVDPDDPAPEHVDAIYGEGALVTRVKDGLPASSSSAPAWSPRCWSFLN
jgi:protein-L-isoaspartate(D-aspartate) O-methyltransferase